MDARPCWVAVLAWVGQDDAKLCLAASALSHGGRVGQVGKEGREGRGRELLPTPPQLSWVPRCRYSQLHEEHDLLGRLDGVVQLDEVPVVQLVHHINFHLGHFLGGRSRTSRTAMSGWGWGRAGSGAQPGAKDMGTHDLPWAPQRLTLSQDSVGI